MTTSPPPVPAAPAPNGLATASMICGILAIPTCLITMLPAVILGHIAWSKARREGGDPGRAKIGLIFGYASLVLIPIIAALAGLTAPMIIRQRQKADQMECVLQARQIGLALEEYASDHNAYPPDLEKLESEQILEDVDKLLRLRNPGRGGEWLYNPRADREKPDAPVLISPPAGNKRAVLRVDGSVSSVPENDLPSTAGGSWISIPSPAKAGR